MMKTGMEGDGFGWDDEEREGEKWLALGKTLGGCQSSRWEKDGASRCGCRAAGSLSASRPFRYEAKVPRATRLALALQSTLHCVGEENVEARGKAGGGGGETASKQQCSATLEVGKGEQRRTAAAVWAWGGWVEQ